MNERREPLYPVVLAKTAAQFFFVFGVRAVFGAIAQINPIWLFGPDRPAIPSHASQPDLYIGLLEERPPDELFMPIPRHLLPLPPPGRVLAQVRARVNHFYVLSRLETPSAGPHPGRTGRQAR